jgi:hypothetical protein
LTALISTWSGRAAIRTVTLGHLSLTADKLRAANQSARFKMAPAARTSKLRVL